MFEAWDDRQKGWDKGERRRKYKWEETWFPLRGMRKNTKPQRLQERWWQTVFLCTQVCGWWTACWMRFGEPKGFLYVATNILMQKEARSQHPLALSVMLKTQKYSAKYIWIKKRGCCNNGLMWCLTVWKQTQGGSNFLAIVKMKKKCFYCEKPLESAEFWSM